MRKNIFSLLRIPIVVFIVMVFLFSAVYSQTINVKDYIKEKFPSIFSFYLSSLEDLDSYEKEFIDLLEKLPEEKQEYYAKEVYKNGFSLELLEKLKRGKTFEESTLEWNKEKEEKSIVKTKEKPKEEVPEEGIALTPTPKTPEILELPEIQIPEIPVIKFPKIPKIPVPTIPVMPKTTEEVTEPSPTIQFRSLSTGTFLVKKLSGGYGELTIENGRDLDAVGVLASSRELKIPLIAVYIQSEDSFTIKGIEDDMYTIYFTLGEDWDSDLEKFTRKATYARFEEELEFETTETATEIRYMTFTVTLHPVVGGTAETEPVREADFPELSN